MKHTLRISGLLLLLAGCAPARAELPDPATGGKDGGPIQLLFLKGNIEIGFGNTIDLDKTLLGKLASARFFQVKDGAKFYFGNLLLASDPGLCLNFASPWTEAEAMNRKEPVTVEVHNPTDKPIAATVRTPKAIPDRKQFSAEVTVPAGTSIFVAVE